MSDTNSLSSNCNHIASQVNSLLEQISGELVVMNNPHMVARRSLGIVGQFGWIKIPYTNEAFDIWSNLLKNSPEDVETIHHLAIMHHAKAFDLEASEHPNQANANWQSALDYWCQLWQKKEFWDKLTADISEQENAAKIINEIHTSWPAELLKVHFDIAFEPQTKTDRIKFHISLALDSPFPSDAKDHVRQITYGQWVSSLDPEVWQIDMLIPEVIEKASDRIKSYLERDAHCIYALADLIRLQEKLIRAHYHEINSLDSDDPERDKKIRLVCQHAPKWEPYLQRLLTVDQLEPDISQKLSFWFYAIGQVFVVAEQYRNAIPYLENAIKADGDLENRQRAEDMLGEALALDCRESAKNAVNPNDREQAKRIADNVKSHKNLSIIAHFYLANAYSLLDEFEQAEKLCRAALVIEPNYTDFTKMEQIEQTKLRIREFQQSIAVSRRRHEVTLLIDEAKKHFENKQYSSAKNVLDRAISIDSEFDIGYFYRAQCYLDAAEPQAALADTKRCKEILAKRNQRVDKKTENALKHLEDECTKMINLQRECGGQEAFKIQQEAIKAYNAGRDSEAISIFRRAIGKSQNPQKLKKELSKILTQTALSKLNPKEKPSNEVIMSIEPMLREAVSLDAQNVDANNYLSQLQQLNEHIHRVEAMNNKYGGHEAVELQQKAVTDFNEGNFDSAISNLRHSINISYNPSKLKEELSQALTAAATSMVNKIVQQPSNASWLIYENKNMLEQAERMLEEAVELHPANMTAKMNLEVLKRLIRR